MPVVGIEPTLTCVKQILSLPRLPFRHTGANRQFSRLAPGSGLQTSRLDEEKDILIVSLQLPSGSMAETAPWVGASRAARSLEPEAQITPP